MSEPPEDLEFESTGQKVTTGTVLGIGVYLVNYVGVYVFLKADGAESNYDGMPLWKFAGQTLYNAQWVPTEVNGRGQSFTYNFVEGTSTDPTFSAAMDDAIVTSTVPGAIYHLLPVVLLFVAGYSLCQIELPDVDTASAAITGACLTPGYLLATVLGRFLFEYSQDGISFAPKTGSAIVTAGLMVPLGFGALGGIVRERTA